MRDADLFVLPSRFDNSPVALIEALASGLPAVASAVGGVAELVGEESVLTRPEQAALAAALEAGLALLPRHDRVATAARAAARFGVDAVARALGEVYAAAAR